MVQCEALTERTRTHTHTYTHEHTHTSTHAHTHTHARTHTSTHAHTHTSAGRRACSCNIGADKVGTILSHGPESHSWLLTRSSEQCLTAWVWISATQHARAYTCKPAHLMIWAHVLMQFGIHTHTHTNTHTNTNTNTHTNTHKHTHT